MPTLSLPVIGGFAATLIAQFVGLAVIPATRGFTAILPTILCIVSFVIGLGIMGTPMAGHLIAGGHSLFAYSRRNIPPLLLEKGATACESSEEVAQASDIVFIMVPDTPHVEDVLFGASGVARGLTPGKIVVDMSSISPLATKDFAKRINDLGCQYLDAPVSGGEVIRRSLESSTGTHLLCDRQ
jgi:6-phosphogluconate dehydrogenase (decarboxylating)